MAPKQGAVVIAAAIAATGAIAASAFSYWNQRRSERLQVELANTAVQRRMADLRRSGINPILAGQGVGAGGVSVQPVRFENPFEDVPDNLATAQRVKNENQLVEEQRAKLKADTAVAEKQLDIQEASLLTSKFQNALTEATTRLNSANADKQEVVNLLYKLVGNSLKKYLGVGERDAGVDTVLRHIGELVGIKPGENPGWSLWKLFSGGEEEKPADWKWEPRHMQSHKEVPTTFRDIRKER